MIYRRVLLVSALTMVIAGCNGTGSSIAPNSLNNLQKFKTDITDTNNADTEKFIYLWQMHMTDATIGVARDDSNHIIYSSGEDGSLNIMDHSFIGRYTYANGLNSSITFLNDNEVAEVHQGKDDPNQLYYCKLDKTKHEFGYWYRLKESCENYTNGSKPQIAKLPDGKLIEAHVSGNHTGVWSSIIDPKIGKAWSSYFFNVAPCADENYRPSVAVLPNGYVAVATATVKGGCGSFSNNNLMLTIFDPYAKKIISKENYTTGFYPSLNVLPDGTLLEMHYADNKNNLWLTTIDPNSGKPIHFNSIGNINGVPGSNIEGLSTLIDPEQKTLKALVFGKHEIFERTAYSKDFDIHDQIDKHGFSFQNYVQNVIKISGNNIDELGMHTLSIENTSDKPLIISLQKSPDRKYDSGNGIGEINLQDQTIDSLAVKNIPYTVYSNLDSDLNGGFNGAKLFSLQVSSIDKKYTTEISVLINANIDANKIFADAVVEPEDTRGAEKCLPAVSIDGVKTIFCNVPDNTNLMGVRVYPNAKMRHYIRFPLKPATTYNFQLDNQPVKRAEGGEGCPEGEIPLERIGRGHIGTFTPVLEGLPKIYVPHKAIPPSKEPPEESSPLSNVYTLQLIKLPMPVELNTTTTMVEKYKVVCLSGECPSDSYLEVTGIDFNRTDKDKMPYAIIPDYDSKRTPDGYLKKEILRLGDVREIAYKITPASKGIYSEAEYNINYAYKIAGITQNRSIRSMKFGGAMQDWSEYSSHLATHSKAQNSLQLGGGTAIGALLSGQQEIGSIHLDAPGAGQYNGALIDLGGDRIFNGVLTNVSMRNTLAPGMHTYEIRGFSVFTDISALIPLFNRDLPVGAALNTMISNDYPDISIFLSSKWGGNQILHTHDDVTPGRTGNDGFGIGQEFDEDENNHLVISYEIPPRENNGNFDRRRLIKIKFSFDPYRVTAAQAAARHNLLQPDVTLGPLGLLQISGSFIPGACPALFNQQGLDFCKSTLEWNPGFQGNLNYSANFVDATINQAANFAYHNYLGGSRPLVNADFVGSGVYGELRFQSQLKGILFNFNNANMQYTPFSFNPSIRSPFNQWILIHRLD